MKTNKSIFRYGVLVLLTGMATGAFAQQSDSHRTDNYRTSTYSLKQCIEYALGNSPVLKNSGIDTKIAGNNIGKARAKALPQINAGVDYMHNVNVQRIVLENGVIPAFTNPQLPNGEVITFQLQLQNLLTASVSGSQVIYDKALFAGMNASATYRELSQKNMEKAKIELVSNVTKAYYGVLVSQKQLGFLDNNMQRLDTLYRETQAKYKAGLTRQIDLDRIEVSLNNLKEEREKSLRTVELSKAVLAYQMNLEDWKNIELKDTLSEGMLIESAAPAVVNYNDRIEYSILQTQKKLNVADLQKTKGEFFPRMYAYATSGYNPAATNVANIFQSSRYYNYTFMGVKLEVPLFHGMQRKYEVQNKYLEDEKLTNSIQQSERMISLEVQQSDINYLKSIESLKIQKRNLDLARQNVTTVKKENEKGIATNLEVTNAETDLKEAQNNYYAALYQALVYKVDLEKARGQLKAN